MNHAVSLTAMLLVMIAQVAGWIAFARFIAKRLDQKGVSLNLAIVAWLLTLASQLLLLRLPAEVYQPENLRVFAAVALVAVLVVPIGVISVLFKTRVGHSILIRLGAAVPSILLFVLVVFVVQPFVFNLYVGPTNSMAPNVLGEHVVGRCVECNAVAVGSSPPTGLGQTHLICTADQSHRGHVDVSAVPIDCDRIVSVKWLRPQRWDVVTFRYPSEPETLTCSRIVGLPGEQIVVRNGTIYANGQSLSPPGSVSTVRYSDLSDSGIRGETIHGSTASPAQLGPDEYFVIGDNNERSFDSRLWQTGAPGRPPFALPADHIDGVVTGIYWPPSRIKTFR